MNENIDILEDSKKNTSIYFFDTYAIFELIRSNPNYKRFTSSKIVTSVFNLAELNYNLKKEMNREKADEYTKDYFSFCADIELEDIQKAMDLKTRVRDLSIPDCIGYVVAKRLGIKFLTGDEGFKNFDNVEFVVK